jgi:hypothetical protein
MKPRVRNLEHVWNGSKTALVLAVIGAGAATWANIRLFPPGVSVAILGAMAAIMSLRPKMRLLEKAGWMLMISAMLAGEIHSIRADRTATNIEQAKVRDAENRRFDEIAEGLEHSIRLSKDQFTITMGNFAQSNRRENTHFESLLREEGHIFSSMQSSEHDTLGALTGGDSYDVLVPTSTGAGPEKASFPLMIAIRGKYTMWDVRIEMKQGPINPEYDASHVAEYFANGWTSVDLGAVSTTYMRPTNFVIHPSAQETNKYFFHTWSRNALTNQELDVRFNADKQSWETAWKIYHEGPEIIEELDFGDVTSRTFPKSGEFPGREAVKKLPGVPIQ